LVVRIAIDYPEHFLAHKQALQQLFGLTYDRHPDPEKQRVLAAVLAVIDPAKLSADANAKIARIIAALDRALRQRTSVTLQSIECVTFNKRTLSLSSRIKVETFHRTRIPRHFSIFTEARDAAVIAQKRKNQAAFDRRFGLIAIR